MTEKLKHYEDGFTTTTEKDGGREQEAVVNTEPGEVHSPEILAKDVKEIVEEADRKQDEHLLENYYDKDEVDDKLDLKADKSTTYTKTQVDNFVNAKQDVIDDESVESGSVSSMLGLDSEGNLVKGTVPAGSVVDSELDTTSENPVENKAIAQAIDDIKTGQTVVGKSQTTEQIDNVGADSGTTQEEPFIFQATATENGMSPDTETAPIAKQLEKQGNSVVVNQILGTNSTASSNGITATNNNDGTFTITGTASDDVAIAIGVVSKISGHKYLLFGAIGGSDTTWYLRDGTAGQNDVGNGVIITAGSTSTTAIALMVKNGTAFSTGKTFRPIYIDLTQWGFSADELTDITTTPSHFFRYYAGSLAYNTGTLTNANSRYLDCIGRNQWDEVWELGVYYTTDGSKGADSSHIRSKNPIRVLGNTTYYFKGAFEYSICFYDKDMNFISATTGTNTTKTTPANCMYVNFTLGSTYGTTYKDDICISIYYEDGTGYDQYYPYEINSYDTGTETLLSAGSVRDIKKPSGEITRKVGSVDLGTLSWSYGSFGDVPGWYTDGLTLSKAGAYDVKPNWICNKYEVVGARSIRLVEGTITNQDSSTRLWVNNGSSTTTPTGTLNFELATPTTEQGTSFAENVIVDNYGSMGWRNATTPQGCKFFYPADYVEFIDSIGMRDDIGFDASKIVSQTQLTAEETARQGQDTILQNAIGGTLRQCLCVKETLDFEDTDFVDLGSLTWTKHLDTNVFYTTLSGGKVNGKGLCTKYIVQNLSWSQVIASADDKFANIQSDGETFYIEVKDTTYADATACKNAMKGVLLAYEKASE